MTAAAPERENVLKEIRTAVRHMAVYGLGNILVRVLGFLMIPFYTHYFTPEDVGILEILDLSMSLFALILNMGMTPALLRAYAAAESAEDKRKVISTACLFAAGTGLLTFLLGLACLHPATGLLFGSKVPAWYVLLSFSSLVLSYMANPARTYLRALDKAATFSILDTAGTLVLLVLNIVFIAWFKMGIVGVLLSSVLVGGIQFALLSGWAFYRAGFHFVRHQMRRMLRFGAPLVFANLGLFVLNFSDRFFLQHLRSLEAVGIYALGYKFGYMMNAMVVQPFFVMWQSRMYNVYAQPDHIKIYQQIFAFYSLGLIYAGLAMSLFSPETVRIMVEPRFAASQDVIPVVVLSYIFYGLSYYAQLGMFLTERTKVIGIIGAASAVLNVVLNYFLIGYFGMMGAAFATLLSFGFLCGVSYWRSQVILRIPLGLERMAAALVIAVALYFGCRRFTQPSTVIAVFAKLAILAAYPVVLWKSRILHPSAAATLSLAIGRVTAVGRRLLGLRVPEAISQ